MPVKNAPVFGSTLFSLGLHLALVVGLLRLPDMPLPAVHGLQIELLRALAAPGQTAEVPTEQGIQQPSVAEQSRPVDKPLITQTAVNHHATSTAKPQPQAAMPRAIAGAGDVADGTDALTADNDTDARTDTMLVLLHDEISNHKRYPYLARRQHREGTARVEFTLHPDGRIDNTALLETSRSRALDRAALSAIEEISPFKPAALYLTQSQTFRIDVVFRLQ